MLLLYTDTDIEKLSPPRPLLSVDTKWTPAQTCMALMCGIQTRFVTSESRLFLLLFLHLSCVLFFSPLRVCLLLTSTTGFCWSWSSGIASALLPHKVTAMDDPPSSTRKMSLLGFCWPVDFSEATAPISGVHTSGHTHKEGEDEHSFRSLRRKGEGRERGVFLIEASCACLLGGPLHLHLGEKKEIKLGCLCRERESRRP